MPWNLLQALGLGAVQAAVLGSGVLEPLGHRRLKQEEDGGGFVWNTPVYGGTWDPCERISWYHLVLN